MKISFYILIVLICPLRGQQTGGKKEEGRIVLNWGSYGEEYDEGEDNVKTEEKKEEFDSDKEEERRKIVSPQIPEMPEMSAHEVRHQPGGLGEGLGEGEAGVGGTGPVIEGKKYLISLSVEI